MTAALVIVFAIVLCTIIFLGFGIAIKLAEGSGRGHLLSRKGRVRHNLDPAETKAFRRSEHGQDILSEYSRAEKKLIRRRNRANKAAGRSKEGTLLYYLFKRRADKKSRQLRQTVTRKRLEMAIMGRAHGAVGDKPKHGGKIARMSVAGSSNSYGIRREGMGHEKHKHEIGRKSRRDKSGGKK